MAGERLLEYELLLVFFRPSSDDSAKRADKELELAALELATDDGATIFIGKVDTDTQKVAAKRSAGYESGRPSMDVFRRGKKLDIGPGRSDARSIVDFLRYLSAPISTKLVGAASRSMGAAQPAHWSSELQSRPAARFAFRLPSRSMPVSRWSASASTVGDSSWMILSNLVAAEILRA